MVHGIRAAANVLGTQSADHLPGYDEHGPSFWYNNGAWEPKIPRWQMASECAIMCKRAGYRYMGLQWISLCKCDNTYGSQGEADGCEVQGLACSVGAELCEFRNAVWDLGEIPLVEAPAQVDCPPPSVSWPFNRGGMPYGMPGWFCGDVLTGCVWHAVPSVENAFPGVPAEYRCVI
eukprot:SAG31_NODE_15371_length_758_cov_1.323217_1_plen_175_part_10